MDTTAVQYDDRIQSLRTTSLLALGHLRAKSLRPPLLGGALRNENVFTTANQHHPIVYKW